jgi:hypothetical protein
LLNLLDALDVAVKAFDGVPCDFRKRGFFSEHDPKCRRCTALAEMHRLMKG